MKLHFEMRIVDESGRVHGVIVQEITRDAAYIGNRAVDDTRFAAEIGMGVFEDTVKMIKVKELRRESLIAVARNGAQRLADYLEDREGWHGLDRQESAESRARNASQG